MNLQFPTIDDHIEDVSEVFGKLPERISDCLRQPRRVLDQLALLDSGGSWTYGQLVDVTDDMESWLIYLGVRAGDRVMIVSENCRAFVAILFALAHIDACPVLVNANLLPREIDRLRALCEARRILYMINASRQANMHATRHQASVINAIDWGPVAIGPLNENAKPEAIEAEISNRVAAEIYSCDSAGYPKIEKLAHRDLLLVAAACTRIPCLTQCNPLYSALPMFSALGLSGVLLPLLLIGATVHLSPNLDRLPAQKKTSADLPRLRHSSRWIAHKC